MTTHAGNDAFTNFFFTSIITVGWCGCTSQFLEHIFWAFEALGPVDIDSHIFFFCICRRNAVIFDMRHRHARLSRFTCDTRICCNFLYPRAVAALLVLFFLEATIFGWRRVRVTCPVECFRSLYNTRLCISIQTYMLLLYHSGVIDKF